jgi:hypothetical protein
MAMNTDEAPHWHIPKSSLRKPGGEFARKRVLRTYRRARPPFCPGSCSQDILNSQFRGEADLILLVAREHSSPRSLWCTGAPIVVAPYRGTTSIPFFAIFAEDSFVPRSTHVADKQLEISRFSSVPLRARPAQNRDGTDTGASVCEGKAERFPLRYAYQRSATSTVT